MTIIQNAAPDIEEAARQLCGYSELRPGQKEAIESLLEGRDTMVIMPTGGGKSAIYQIAGSLMDGPALVVSPLIALQRDQVESIQHQDATGDAAQLNSTLSKVAREAAWEGYREGQVGYLFLAPEQLSNPETLQRLQETKPALFVIDEAHCVSDWGHDFRPDYLRLSGVIEALGHPPVLALTATAAPPVRSEIAERLGMHDPRVIVQGFNRPNIWLGVGMYQEEGDKLQAVLDHVIQAEKPGIVYVATRKHAESVALALNEVGVRAEAYHAGMKASEREAAQSAFLGDEAEVIVATKAFGMGIDKPNVRFVYHYDISDSVDSYYQEVGRAGRDGDPATAILFYSSKDMHTQRFLTSSGGLDVEQVRRVAEALAEEETPVTARELAKDTELSTQKVLTALNRLEDAGVVETSPTGEIQPTEGVVDLESAAEEAVEMQEHHREFERSRLQMIERYAELRDCRREYLLNYFGETLGGPCGRCDNCERFNLAAGGDHGHDSGEDWPFPMNSRVRHELWGEGEVLRYEDDKLVVLFDEVGYKTLGIEIVIERGLLQLMNGKPSEGDNFENAG